MSGMSGIPLSVGQEEKEGGRGERQFIAECKIPSLGFFQQYSNELKENLIYIIYIYYFWAKLGRNFTFQQDAELKDEVKAPHECLNNTKVNVLQ